VQTHSKSVEVSAFRDGQLGGGCLVSLPKRKPMEDEGALIRFLVTESASLGKLGKVIGQIQILRSHSGTGTGAGSNFVVGPANHLKSLRFQAEARESVPLILK